MQRRARSMMGRGVARRGQAEQAEAEGMSAPEAEAPTAALALAWASGELADTAAGPLRRGALAALQGARGNGAAQRAVTGVQVAQRQAAPAAVDPEQAAREAFVARGVMPSAAGLDQTSGTGLGGFNVRYDPARQSLDITLRVGVNFIDGIRVIDPATGAIAPNHTDLAASAAGLTASHPDPAARVAEVQASWQWAGREADWMAQYEAMAEVAWGQQHHFRSRRWSDLFANVNVNLDVHQGHRADDHCRATVYYVPAGNSVMGAVVNSTGSPTGYTGTFTSAGLGAPSDFLNYRLQYGEGKTAVADGVGATSVGNGDPGPTYLDKFIADFQRGRPGEGAPVTITGRASATGDPAVNQRISERRARNVAAYLQSHGDMIAGYRITATGAGQDGASADPEWCRVDIQVGDGQAQVTMTHETGHMFGLDDEYASPAGGFAPGAGTPGTIGDPTGHNTQAAAMGGGVQGAVYENNDNIMSVGNVVRPQHYATFLEALNAVTTPEAFEYGGAGPAPTAIPDLFGPHVPASDTATA